MMCLPAYSVEEMPGINLEIDIHWLNVNQNLKLVR